MIPEFRSIVATFFLAAIASLAGAQDMIEQSFDVSGDLASGFIDLTVEPFDNLNDTRQLIGLTLEFDGRIDFEIEIKNYTTLDLDPGEWAYDAGANMILAFDEKPGYENGGPFFGLGGIYEPGITGTLTAGSGGPPPPFGNPTAGDVTVTADFGESFVSEIEADRGMFYFVGDQPLKAKFAPFQDLVVTPPDGEPNGFIDGKITSLDFSGELILTYNWVEGLGRPEDCNGDGNVDFEDLRCVCGEQFANLEDVLAATNLIKGDLNGDGEVAFADFLILSNGFGDEGTYLDGDIDCNGEVDFGDFLILSQNFGFTNEEALAVVPEPSSMWLLLAAGSSVVAQRRRFNCRIR